MQKLDSEASVSAYRCLPEPNGGQVLAYNHFLGCDVRGKVRGTPRTLLLETLQKFLKLGTHLGLL